MSINNNELPTSTGLVGNKLAKLTIAVGSFMTIAGVVDLFPTTALAHEASIQVVERCSDGTAAGSNKELQINPSQFGDSIGNTITIYDEGKAIGTPHLVTNDNVNKAYGDQLGSGDHSLVLKWENNPNGTTPLVVHLAQCEVSTTTTTTIPKATTTTIEAATTTTTTEATTTIPETVITTKSQTTTTGVAPLPTTSGMLPKTGGPKSSSELSLAALGTVAAGLALVAVGRRRRTSN